MEPSYTVDGLEMTYTPRMYLTNLDWFNIAKCARARMTEHSDIFLRWRGERRSFYTSLQRIATNVTLYDED